MRVTVQQEAGKVLKNVLLPGARPPCSSRGLGICRGPGQPLHPVVPFSAHQYPIPTTLTVRLGEVSGPPRVTQLSWLKLKPISGAAGPGRL